MFNLKQKWYPLYWKRISRWLDKRQPAAANVTLTQRTIFILPTRFGCWFALLFILLYLLGTNYQNNLILLLCYLLLALFLLSITLAYRNLSGLQLSCPGVHESFCEQPLPVRIVLDNQVQRFMLSFQFISDKDVTVQQTAQTDVLVSLTSTTRGCFTLPRLKLSSVYPFGLWRSWSYIALSHQYWVYPQPKPTDYPVTTALKNNQPYTDTEISNNLSAYQPGDNLNQLLWKRLARDPANPVVRLRHPVSETDPQWVTVPALRGAALEQALQQACYQLIQLQQQDQHYGLRLPHITVPQASGSQQLQRCLQQLALCK